MYLALKDRNFEICTFCSEKAVYIDAENIDQPLYSCEEHKDKLCEPIEIKL